MIAGTLQTDPRSGGIKRSSGVNVMPAIAEGAWLRLFTNCPNFQLQLIESSISRVINIYYVYYLLSTIVHIFYILSNKSLDPSTRQWQHGSGLGDCGLRQWQQDGHYGNCQGQWRHRGLRGRSPRGGTLLWWLSIVEWTLPTLLLRTRCGFCHEEGTRQYAQERCFECYGGLRRRSQHETRHDRGRLLASRLTELATSI